MATDLHTVRSSASCAGIRVTSRSEWRVGIELSGELDCAVADELDALLSAELSAGRHLVQLHLDGVSFMDCSIVGVLAAADARCRAECAALLLVGVGPRVARLISLCGLDNVLLMNGDKPDPGRADANKAAATENSRRAGEFRLAQPGPA